MATQTSDRKRYAMSRARLKEAGAIIPGGVTSNVRLREIPFPLFYKRGLGSRLWDVDGNEYIDYVLANGPMILGHSPASVLDRVRQATADLQICAAQTELEIELAQQIVQIVPSAEMVRFSLSGSEAVQAALRLARACTQRQKVLKFEGHYHGWFDNVLIGTGVATPRSDAQTNPDGSADPGIETRGQDPGATANTIVLSWNNLELVERAFRDHPDQIAAVITEPIACNSARILPEPGYLEGLKTLCERQGAVLIFDEVITGFRVGLSGAQGVLGVTPHLSVFGKAIAAGFPLAVLAGQRQLMQRFGNGQVNHSGTFNGHVASLAAGLATLEELRKDDGAAFLQIKQVGQLLMDQIPRLFQRRGFACLVQGLPSVFFVGFTDQQRITNAKSAALCDSERYNELVAALMNRGVRVNPGGGVNVSASHTIEDANETLSRIEDALGDVQA